MLTCCLVAGMNIFVAFFVLLLLLAESTPPAASAIPLIGESLCHPPTRRFFRNDPLLNVENILLSYISI